MNQSRVHPVNSRRSFLRAGLTGFSSLSLSNLYQLRAEAGKKSQGGKAIIMVWLRGGASHLETFDPKPLASSAYRGPFRPINTNVPGIQIGELLPKLSQIADKYTILRSMVQTGPGHPSGSLQLLGGDPDTKDKLKPAYPDWMSVVNYLHKNTTSKLPNYIAVNQVDRYDSFKIAGPAYLGPTYEPFVVKGDLNNPQFQVPNIGLASKAYESRFIDRMKLKSKLDNISRVMDQSGTMSAIDSFETQAVDLLTSKDARQAFNLKLESASTRERYGRNQWGQQCLMARRLVEAGVEVVATEFDGRLCGRVQNWDDHAVNHNVFDVNQFRLPVFDQAISALIEDIYARGLDKRVMVVVTGEFGRTPKISYVKSSGGGQSSAAKGIVQPGRDHWPRANSMIFAGGGIETGQVIGKTDIRGEDVIERRFSPGDFLATIYNHLGIDYEHIALRDFKGRPNPILNEGSPIKELASQS